MGVNIKKWILYIHTDKKDYQVHDFEQFYSTIYDNAGERRVLTHDYGNVIYYETVDGELLGMIDKGGLKWTKCY